MAVAFYSIFNFVTRSSCCAGMSIQQDRAALVDGLGGATDMADELPAEFYRRHYSSLQSQQEAQQGGFKKMKR